MKIRKCFATSIIVLVLITFFALNAESGELSGRVKWRNNTPAQGVTMTIGAYSVVTDQHGIYSFKFLNPGRYVLVIGASGKPSRSFWVSISEVSNQQDFIINW
jgi:hypothetical protein